MSNVRAGIAKELHKQVRRNYPTRYVELKGINDLYQADLVEMIPFSRFNKGFKYIMTIINCFSKFAIAIPLKSKSANDIVNALEPILQQFPMKHFQTDQGTEWFNSKVKLLLNKYNINHYYTFSDKKASIIERFNRTLKNNMWRNFTQQGNFKWLFILNNLLKTYNDTVHRTIGVKPNQVSSVNEKEILLRIVKNRKVLNNNNNNFKIKFNINDRVRISRLPKQFNKGYWPRWSNEIYTVSKIQPTKPVTYILKDYKGDLIQGGFYEEELSKTRFRDTYLIEKVIKRKGDKLLVRWLGFDKTHDSWIDKKDLQH